MDSTIRHENEHFENEVRRIARALWPSAEFQGAIMLDGREIDGVFQTEDCIHVVEATTSRRKDKAQQDITKLDKILNKLQRRYRTRASRGWFITRDEPTAEQRKVTDKNHSINILSFSQFQAKLINSRAYLNARDNYPFGSVRDPATGKHLSQDIAYIPLDMVRVDSKEIVSRNDLLSLMCQGCTAVLLGDYGAGKSMTLREIYYALREKHLKNETSTFPVYLNLRDHWGQTDTSEVIERHAKRIGFAQPSHLVRAWRAGYVHLLIDGFDEISTTSIQGIWRKLQESRFRAMQVVRCLIDEHPSGTGLLVAGRAHFFDNQTEQHKALGLPGNCIELSLEERSLTEGQINAALEQAQSHDAEHMAVDLVRLLQEVGFNLSQEVKVRGLWIREFELDAIGTDLSKLKFEDCFFDLIEIDPQVDVNKMPSFHECYISELEGRVSRDDLPRGKFDDKCDIEKFSGTAETTAKVLTLDLPLGMRVCLTVLRKLYEQRGSGRRENALYRGLDDRARRLVSEVLHVLQSEGLAIQDRSRNNIIWRPDRSNRARVGRMITAPTAANDRVLELCGQLQS